MDERSPALCRKGNSSRLNITLKPKEGGRHHADGSRNHGEANGGSAPGCQHVSRRIDDSVAKAHGHSECCQPIGARSPLGWCHATASPSTIGRASMVPVFHYPNHTPFQQRHGITRLKWASVAPLACAATRTTGARYSIFARALAPGCGVREKADRRLGHSALFS